MVRRMTVTSNGRPAPDRRAVRRRQTIEEILGLAEEVMTEEGVHGLSLSEVARRLGVAPPSLYKYFPSLAAVYESLFLLGQQRHLAEMRTAMSGRSGLDALHHGLDASGRWALENRALAQLMFWRPVPSFEPSPDGLAVSAEMVEIQRVALREAVAAGELDAAADSEEAIHLLSTLIVGVISQAMSNEPGLPWGEGRFSPVFPRLMALFAAGYPPERSGPAPGRTS